MTFPQIIEQRAGAPATVRVGIVVGVAPLRVQIQNTVYPDVAYLHTLPSVGDVVLVLGQSVTGAQGSGSSWIVLGVPQQG
jgi:hypothetical protein